MKEDEILSVPIGAKPKEISSVDLQLTKFYNDDDYSRPLSERKDYVSVCINGEKQHVQKCLLFENLSELYQAFKNQHPTIKLSFAKFSSIRQK